MKKILSLSVLSFLAFLLLWSIPLNASTMPKAQQWIPFYLQASQEANSTECYLNTTLEYPELSSITSNGTVYINFYGPVFAKKEMTYEEVISNDNMQWVSAYWPIINIMPEPIAGNKKISYTFSCGKWESGASTFKCDSYITSFAPNTIPTPLEVDFSPHNLYAYGIWAVVQFIPKDDKDDKKISGEIFRKIRFVRVPVTNDYDLMAHNSENLIVSFYSPWTDHALMMEHVDTRSTSIFPYVEIYYQSY